MCLLKYVCVEYMYILVVNIVCILLYESYVGLSIVRGKG